MLKKLIAFCEGDRVVEDIIKTARITVLTNYKIPTSPLHLSENPADCIMVKLEFFVMVKS